MIRRFLRAIDKFAADLVTALSPGPPRPRHSWHQHPGGAARMPTAAEDMRRTADARYGR